MNAALYPPVHLLRITSGMPCPSGLDYLINRCRSERPSIPAFPTDGVETLLMAQSGGRILSALALLTGDPAECVIYTDPDFRSRGLARYLLSAAEEDISDVDVLFFASGDDAATLSALRAIGAEHDADHLLMELSLTAPPLAGTPSPVPDIAVSAEGDALLFTAAQPAQNIGHCRITLFADSACFHDLWVEPDFRRHGVGRALLTRSIRELTARTKVSRLWLHVLGDNSAAIALYKKTGFRVTETLCQYLY